MFERENTINIIIVLISFLFFLRLTNINRKELY